MRLLQLVAALHLAVILGVGAVRLSAATPVLQPQAPAPAAAASGGRAWFERVKPSCNPVEVHTALRHIPPPSDAEGQGFAAACYALAGKIIDADGIIARLDAQDAHRAAGIVFAVGHPVADAGDDDSAGPIMRLVVKYQPQNFMALYHAGVSSYNLGDWDLARDHLERFLELYKQEDGWRKNGKTVLARIAAGEGGTVFSGEEKKP